MKIHGHEAFNIFYKACKSREPIDILGLKFMVEEISWEHPNYDFSAEIKLTQLFDVF